MDSCQPSLFAAPGLRYVIRDYPGSDFAVVVDTATGRVRTTGTRGFCEDVAAAWNAGEGGQKLNLKRG